MNMEKFKADCADVARDIQFCMSSDGEFCLISVTPKTADVFIKLIHSSAIENNVRSILPKIAYGRMDFTGGLFTVEVVPEFVGILADRLGKKYLVSIMSDNRIAEKQELSPEKTQCKKTRRVTACTYSSYHR